MTVRPFPRHDDDKDAIAGRELDTVVAEKVMELRTTGRGDRHLVSGYDDPEGWGHPDNVWEDVPHYSTDIVAAWMIVGKLIAEDRQVTLSHRGRNDQWLWHASISEAGSGLVYGGWEAFAESAPLAICVAALKVTDRYPPARRSLLVNNDVENRTLTITEMVDDPEDVE